MTRAASSAPSAAASTPSATTSPRSSSKRRPSRMKSTARQTEPRGFAGVAFVGAAGGGPPEGEAEPRALAPARWDWSRVRRVLVVRLRSIGDTVLATPSLHALRRFLPGARIDVLLEDWVAPLLDGSDDVDRVLTVRRKS